MGVKVNFDKIYADYRKQGKKTAFPDSLKKIFSFASKDKNLKSIEDFAYLLATAKAESDYSLTRWEADYLCGGQGVPYKGKPCQKALNYYRERKPNKLDYYTLGTDKNGLPYFGRGLIQLTSKSNYETYGDLIGVDLLSDGDKALDPVNSYKIASAYLSRKRGGIYAKNGVKRNTFDLVKDGEFTLARKSVNGGTNGLKETNTAYNYWLNALKKNDAKVVNGNESSTGTNTKKWLGIGLSVITIGVTGTLIYLYLKKNNKLPNFIKNIKIKK